MFHVWFILTYFWVRAIGQTSHALHLGRLVALGRSAFTAMAVKPALPRLELAFTLVPEGRNAPVAIKSIGKV